MERRQRSRYTRHHDRWAQRIQNQGTQQTEYPSLNDQGTQRVLYPTGQIVQYPCVNDTAASSQIQVKCDYFGGSLMVHI